MGGNALGHGRYSWLMTTTSSNTGLRLLLLGATGAVGTQVLTLALADQRIAQITAPTRRPLAIKSKSLNNPVVDFQQDLSAADWLEADGVVCALGSTIREAGSQAAFAFVDRDLPIRFATWAKQRGALSFALNSSLGASARGNFYLRTKAEAEAAIAGLGYVSYTVVRPSLIDADRPKVRPGEVLGNAIGKIFRPLIPARYRPVSAMLIAKALLEAAVQGKAGHHVIESEALR